MRFFLKLIYCVLFFSFNLVTNNGYSYSFYWPWGNSSQNTFHLDNILGLEQILENKVVGQPYAVKVVSDMMITYSAKLHNKNEPIGCLLFIGTTGVGKTELAKVLAKEITVEATQFLRLNMSEFNTDSGLDRMIGMPWGYIDSEKSGELSQTILKNPYSIILLDEFEKASMKVRMLFLHIFDEGYFTNSRGEYVDCRNCIFIATSNLGTEIIQKGWKTNCNYYEILDSVEPLIISKLSPELYSRMHPVLFQSMSASQMIKIVEMKLKEVSDRVYAERDVRIFFDPTVVNYVVASCHSLDNGVRPVLNIINKDVVSVISRFLVSNNLNNNKNLSIVYNKTEATLKILTDEITSDDLSYSYPSRFN